MAGALVEVALAAALGAAFVPVVPAVLWAIWYLGWGHTAHTFVSFHNAANLPSYVLDGLARALGLSRAQSADRGGRDPGSCLGAPLLVLLVGLAIWRVYRLAAARPALATLAILLGYWSLTALNASIFGLPTAGRYQYLGVVGLALSRPSSFAGARDRAMGHRRDPRGRGRWRPRQLSRGSGTPPPASRGSPSRSGAASRRSSSPATASTRTSS